MAVPVEESVPFRQLIFEPPKRISDLVMCAKQHCELYLGVLKGFFVHYHLVLVQDGDLEAFSVARFSFSGSFC